MSREQLEARLRELAETGEKLTAQINMVRGAIAEVNRQLGLLVPEVPELRQDDVRESPVPIRK